ncbi:MAG: carboxypeptidase regulatory-like domain-containing protein [Bryobacteraceae bacterium]
MTIKRASSTLQILLIFAPLLAAQDPTGVIEGQITDPSGANVPNAEVRARQTQTGFVATQHSGRDGTFHFSYLPVGEYDLHVTARGFASFDSSGIRIDVNRNISLPVPLQIGPSSSRLTVAANAATIDVSSTLGNVVSSREITDLPLNGRNFTQLGLLQPGVAPLTSGLAEAGGILRSGQAYAVNGERPESNNYLLDGATNVDSVNGGFALRTPVDAVSEFRILTSNAPAEYGQTSGATTTVITKSGGNSFHGNLYEFSEKRCF